MKLYRELAPWWPLFSPPFHYVEEAADLVPRLRALTDPPPRTVLELGSGGGSLAFHLKRHFAMTLTDLSPGMLENSRAINPECEHIAGDMRTLDLGRTFDAVFIHDAVCYLTDTASLDAAFATARRHLRAGGGLLIAPDFVRETFEPGTEDGGEDGADGRGVRWLEWRWDRDPADTVYEVAYALMLRTADGNITVDLDRHVEGIFPRATWVELLEQNGFAVSVSRDRWNRDLFTGRLA